MMKRGASIVWAIIIAGVLLIVSTTTATFIVKESQMGVRMDDSAKAYAAAESGIEWAKACIGDKTGCFANNIVGTGGSGFKTTWPTFQIKSDKGNVTYRVSVKNADPAQPANNAGPNYLIDSLGTSNGANRQIEYTYALSPGAPFLDTDSLVVGDNFNMSFRYWTANQTSLIGTKIGLRDASGKFLGVKIYGSTFNLDAETNVDTGSGILNELTDPTITNASGSISVSSSYLQATGGLLIGLDYVKDHSLRLTISGEDASGNIACLGTKTWFFSGSVYELGSVASVKYYSGSSVLTTPRMMSGSFPAESLTSDTVTKVTVTSTVGFFASFYGVGIGTSAAAPIISIPSGGNIPTNTSVTLSSTTAGAHFYYTSTINGSAIPTLASPNLPNPGTILITGSVGNTVTVEAFSHVAGQTDSAVISATYTIIAAPTPTPTPTPQQTVTIGTQVWMAKNLDVGTMINSSVVQTNNSLIEKYCYNDDPTNCAANGGLYLWDEMMQYTTAEGAQGVCPVGFHVPSDNDWKVLEKFLGMTQAQADATGLRGTDQGTQIQSGVNGFLAALAGRFNATFYGLNQYGYYYTSTQNSADITKAFYRGLYYNQSTIYRNNATSKAVNAFSVRCIKN